MTFKDKEKILCSLGLRHIHIQKEEINYKFENNYHIHNSYELEKTWKQLKLAMNTSHLGVDKNFKDVLTYDGWLCSKVHMT